MKNKNITILVITIIILLFILIIKINNKNETKITSTNIFQKNTIKNNNTTVIKTQRNDVYIESHKGYSYSIKGIVKNGTANTINSVYITADLYDKKGNKLGNCNDIISSLAPGETWAFSMPHSKTEYIYKNLKVTYKNN